MLTKPAQEFPEFILFYLRQRSTVSEIVSHCENPHWATCSLINFFASKAEKHPSPVSLRIAMLRVGGEILSAVTFQRKRLQTKCLVTGNGREYGG